MASHQQMPRQIVDPLRSQQLHASGIQPAARGEIVTAESVEDTPDLPSRRSCTCMYHACSSVQKLASAFFLCSASTMSAMYSTTACSMLNVLASSAAYSVFSFGLG